MSGSIAAFNWTAMANLGSLNLSNNQFSGPLPQSWGGLRAGPLSADVARNHLTGQLPAAWGDVVPGLGPMQLALLNASFNNLTGEGCRECSCLVASRTSDLRAPCPRRARHCFPPTQHHPRHAAAKLGQPLQSVTHIAAAGQQQPDGQHTRSMGRPQQHSVGRAGCLGRCAGHQQQPHVWPPACMVHHPVCQRLQPGQRGVPCTR